MADRLNGASYGMPHPGFNPAMLSQQQQQQMQQVDAQATIGGLQNPEHGRMWQQMQQQHRNTFGGGMLNGQSINPQQVRFSLPFLYFSPPPKKVFTRLAPSPFSP